MQFSVGGVAHLLFGMFLAVIFLPLSLYSKLPNNATGHSGLITENRR